ncbi:hypothetical protein HYV31_01480 [candidate division WWE3 bacterium]|nr:hypothetical protein [candidate division WWE3 bacterium]
MKKNLVYFRLDRLEAGIVFVMTFWLAFLSTALFDNSVTYALLSSFTVVIIVFYLLRFQIYLVEKSWVWRIQLCKAVGYHAGYYLMIAFGALLSTATAAALFFLFRGQQLSPRDIQTAGIICASVVSARVVWLGFVFNQTPLLDCRMLPIKKNPLSQLHVYSTEFEQFFLVDSSWEIRPDGEIAWGYADSVPNYLSREYTFVLPPYCFMYVSLGDRLDWDEEDLGDIP